jgi:hypothetical protein
MSTSTSWCCRGRISVWARDYGFTTPYSEDPDMDYYCLATQCHRNALKNPTDDQDKYLCGSCNKSLPAGKFGEAIPEYALCDGKMRDLHNNIHSFKKGDQMCWLFANPDIIKQDWMGEDGSYALTHIDQSPYEGDAWNIHGDDEDCEQTESDPEDAPKKRGRPKGSKNKSSSESDSESDPEDAPKKRGRPKGSKNMSSSESDSEDTPKKKRPPSEYNLFFKEQMPIWKADNPDANHRDAMIAIGAAWTENKNQ